MPTVNYSKSAELNGFQVMKVIALSLHTHCVWNGYLKNNGGHTHILKNTGAGLLKNTSKEQDGSSSGQNIDLFGLETLSIKR